MAQFMPGELDPLQKYDLERRMKMAQALRQNQPQGQMVGNVFVAPSITQHLAAALSNFAGRKDEDAAVAEAKQQATQKQEKTASAAQRLAAALSGKTVEQPVDYMEAGGMPGITQTVQKPPTPQEIFQAQMQYGVDIGDQQIFNAALESMGKHLIPKQSEPYYQYIDTPDGLLKVDARGINPPELVTNQQTGMPFIKSASSPTLQGTIASEKARGSAEWKPNTDIPGTITTDANVVRDINNGMPTNNFNTPYPVTFGAPGTTATDRNEGIFGASDIRVGNPASPNRKGIQVPTAAQLAGAKTKAEEEAKAAVEMVTKPQIEAATVTAKSAAESQAKKDSTMSGIGSIIDEARGLLKGKTKPTSSMVGSIADTLGGVVGVAVPGSAEADQLKAIGGALVAKMPRMEGPQSNFDVQSYQRMAGDIGNDKLPIARRLKALESVEKLWRKYDKTEAKAAPTIPSMDAIQAELARRRGGK